MPLKFAANLSMMFKEVESISGKYEAAKRAGFQAVEGGSVFEASPEEWGKAREESGLEHTLINAYSGNLKAGERGLAAIPNKLKEFREGIELSIKYCKALKCPRMHIMAGVKPLLWEDSAMEEVYVDNLKWAGERLKQENLIGLVEPISPIFTIPKYFIDTPEKALEMVKKVNHPNIKFQLDVYHIQLTAGGLTTNIKKYLPYTGHIQIAQAPDRHEPSSEGEINYQYVLSLLERHGYNGWIGLEYIPSGKTEESLKWIKEWGY